MKGLCKRLPNPTLPLDSARPSEKKALISLLSPFNIHFRTMLLTAPHLPCKDNEV
ncbi:hypothetical protein SK128_001928, partial [Halocaridina rubra]